MNLRWLVSSARSRAAWKACGESSDAVVVPAGPACIKISIAIRPRTHLMHKSNAVHEFDMSGFKLHKKKFKGCISKFAFQLAHLTDH